MSKINGIDVNKPVLSATNNNIYYSQNAVDELLNNIKRLQEENKELKSRNANLRLNLATYDLPEIKKVLTDWRTGELDIKFKKLQKENEKLKKLKCEFKEYCTCDTEKYRSALEEIRKAIGKKYGMADIIKIRTIFNEVLND
jgi:hypothetical protein